MTTTRSVALLVLVAVVGLVAAPLASGAVAGAFTDDHDHEQNESETNTTVSTFMQASAADAENAIDDGMFEAKYDAADEDRRADVVLERTDELEAQLAELEAERAALQEREDELHRGEYQARMTQLTVEIKSLERSIDRTEQRANETGVSEDRLTELRKNASDLAGPEVTAIARGLGVDDAPGNGPPDDARGADRGNGAERGNSQPPEHAGPGSSPGGSGNGNDSGQDSNSNPDPGPDKD